MGWEGGPVNLNWNLTWKARSRQRFYFFPEPRFIAYGACSSATAEAHASGIEGPVCDA